MTGDQSHVTKSLAQFVAGSQWDAIPPEVRCEGVRGLLNFVGCALGGARDEAMDIAVTVLAPFFGAPQAIVIGRGERPDALNAAFLNAVSANVLEYDDTHVGTVMHPAGPVASGLFALAELRPVSGRELLHAFILGVETSCRVGLAVMPTHYRRGWHITATCGIFGAAAACARLIGLDVRRTAWALGHAATQSASLVESLGSMSKSLGVGNAAKNGLAAALLAEGGFSGPDKPIEGRYGVCGGDQRLGRSRAYNRRDRRTLGSAEQRVQALSVRGRTVPGHRRLFRTTRPSCAGAGSNRPRRRARPPADARAHRPAERRERARCQGQPAA